MPNIPRKIIVHHTGDADPNEQLQKIDADHKAKGFTQSSLGFFVGYHYLIPRGGIYTQTRKDDEQGCHDKGENADTLGVALEGNFNVEMPTNEQVVTLGALLVQLCDTYALGAQNIEPHRIDDTTDCYGTRLSNDWARIIYLEAQARALKDRVDTLWLKNTQN